MIKSTHASRKSWKENDIMDYRRKKVTMFLLVCYVNATRCVGNIGTLSIINDPKNVTLALIYPTVTHTYPPNKPINLNKYDVNCHQSFSSWFFRFFFNYVHSCCQWWSGSVAISPAAHMEVFTDAQLARFICVFSRSLGTQPALRARRLHGR